MKKVTILVPNEAVMASIADPRMMFVWVNDFLKQEGQPPIFEIQFAGLEREVKVYDGLFSVKTDILIKDIKKTDLIIIPAIGGEFRNTIKKNEDFFPWIINQYKKGTEVASLCVGSFLLAATGLLNGKECSSHWLAANQFRELFPEVTLVDGRIITENQGLYSSGGAISYWNLLLHLVDKYAGREMAIKTAKIFALDIDRKSQSPFVIFNGQKKHEDEPIKQAQEYIEGNFTERILVEELAVKFAIGRRHFERRFKKATNNTPVEYIQRVKIEAAKKQLESGRRNVNEVMYDVGYSDKKAFRSVFMKIAGMTPADYRKKFYTNAISI